MTNPRESYKHFQTIATRWNDNDVYGHVNNIEYYGYFDTAINTYLIAEGVLNIHDGKIIGVCAESHCRFLQGLAFPETIEAGLRVERIGKSSVRYGIGLFRSGQTSPAAEGWWVQVFVDRATRRPFPLPVELRASLERLLSEAST